MDPLLRRLTTGRRGRIAAVIAAAAAVLLLGVSVVAAGALAGGGSTTLPAVAVERTAAPSPTPLLVAVAGAVRRPGLVALPPGARVVDALAAAGGPASDADQAGVNLAAPVVDGQQVVVPRRGVAGAATGSAATTAGATVSLNGATAEQLETLPRVGPAMAARIIAWRQAHGGFRSVDDLGEVGGIGPKTLAALRGLVTP